jgi:signal transduction histidine kinase
MFRSLSVRLLVLTISFVMLAEILIFVPSVAQFRRVWLEEHLASAQLASLALEATPDAMISPELEAELLANAMVQAVILKRAQSRTLMLSEDMPVVVDALYDLRKDTFMNLIGDALMLLVKGSRGSIQVTGAALEGGGEYVAIIFAERHLHQAMVAYGQNILLISLVISLFTAVLIYISLFRLFVRPMQRLTDNMVRFSENPQDPTRVINPTGRRDEIGTAELQLHDMQEQVRQSLEQKTRLANLGEAVAKINHDLRNMLATAQLVSDRLAKSKDPSVHKFAPTLVRAIDRAIELCAQTLRYGRAEEPKPRVIAFELAPLVDEVGHSVGLTAGNGAVFRNCVPAALQVDADPDQLFRALQNLVRNAHQALGDLLGEISVSAVEENGEIRIDVADTGPGVPEKAQANLFKPFQGSTREGGTGLGLVNVQEIARAHGGDVILCSTGETGTIFRMRLPRARNVAMHN